jgi:excisionase family DNA binding protein
MDPTPTLNRAGRAKFTRNKRTFDDLEILEAIATEALTDGRLTLTMERTAWALGVDLSTIRSMVASGELPSFGLGDHRRKRFIKIPAEAVLELVRSRSPKGTSQPAAHFGSGNVSTEGA